jgi:quercetin dioxygenase-like cupin family protein
MDSMETNYSFIAELSGEVEIPVNGILSRTLHNDERVKIVIFGFAPGQELTAHTAPMPAVIHILQGEARLTLGADHKEVSAGAWVHMQPQLEHGILAKTPVVMLLTMIKGRAAS